MYVIKNKTFLISVLAAMTLFGMSSCDDIIAKNLSDERPVVILPQTGSTIDENPVHFKWSEVDGATKYRIQVVSPSFASISIYAVDSIVSGTNFSIPLDSNNYQLRITALNAGYESQPSLITSFAVGTNSGSGSGSVTLVTPENNKFIGSSSVLFKWNSIANLQNYTFELHSGPTFADPFTIQPEQLAAVQLGVDELPEGTYSWGVKAYLTDGTETAFTKRIFHVDLTDPGAVTLLSPSNNTTFQTSLIQLSWSALNPGTEPSEITYTVEIARDNQFADIVVAPAPETTETTYTFQGITEDVYYWRIRTIDEAGNEGPVSPVYTFTKTF